MDDFSLSFSRRSCSVFFCKNKVKRPAITGAMASVVPMFGTEKFFVFLLTFSRVVFGILGFRFCILSLFLLVAIVAAMTTQGDQQSPVP